MSQGSRSPLAVALGTLRPSGLVFRLYITSLGIGLLAGTANFYARFFSIRELTWSQNVALFFVLATIFVAITLSQRLVRASSRLSPSARFSFSTIAASLLSGTLAALVGYATSITLYFLDLGELGALHAIPINSFFVGLIAGALAWLETESGDG